jgi:hypothetical protein
MSTMSQTAMPTLQKLDPLKRVNYRFGLVLGVEEFLQSDTYFLAKHHLENRLLHGYGTVCGLDVIAQTSPQVEVQVTPGWAINPKGQEIFVSQLMCLQVNDWLQANQSALQAAFPAPGPSSLTLCVVLCYRECKTDAVPIPGEPCQTQSSSMAPSRIADSFELMLCLNPDASPPLASPPLSSPPASPSASTSLCLFGPAQADVEQDAIRAFAQLLSEIQTSTTGPFLTLAQLQQLVRDLAQPLTSPPVSSPPSGPPYYVEAADSSEFLRAAFRTWITEVRPSLAASPGAGPCCPPAEKCVLLAEITLTLNSSRTATAVTVDDSRRPFLLSTRLLQELAFKESAAAFGGPPYKPVAAGYFQTNGTPDGPVYNNLTAVLTPPGDYLLTFPGYQPGNHYIVKGTVQDSTIPAAIRATCELVAFQPTGIQIRILDTASAAIGAGLGFMVEISQIGGGS